MLRCEVDTNATDTVTSTPGVATTATATEAGGRDVSLAHQHPDLHCFPQPSVDEREERHWGGGGVLEPFLHVLLKFILLLYGKTPPAEEECQQCQNFLGFCRYICVDCSFTNLGVGGRSVHPLRCTLAPP